MKGLFSTRLPLQASQPYKAARRVLASLNCVFTITWPVSDAVMKTDTNVIPPVVLRSEVRWAESEASV